MYKILVTDDDPNIRIGLTQMINNAYTGSVLVDTAENGLLAFEKITKFHFDVLITDIKMPIWGGLELLEHLKEEYHIPPTLVLSGYDDYNLVRNSLKLGAADYLLKPVNEGLLLSSLDSMLKTLKINSSDSANEKADLKDQILLECFLEHAPLAEEKEMFMEQNNLTTSTYCKMLYADLSHGLYSQRQKIRTFIESCFHDFFVSSSSYLPIYGELQQYWVLLLFEIKERKKCEALVDGFYRKLKNEGIVVSICQSSRPLSDIPLLKAECLHNFENYFFDLPYSYEKNSNAFSEQELTASTVEALSDYDYSKAIGKLSLLFALFNAQRPSISHLRRVLTNLVFELMQKNPNFIPVVSESSLTDYDIFANIENAGSLKELQTLIFANLNEYIGKVVDSLNNKEDYVIRKAKEYIHNNYSDSITLNDIAAYVFLSPGYFSTLFKSQTGITFRQYLRDYRIQISKKLIRQGSYKIYEVASAVGYPEPSHFVRAFKEVTGVSPSEFKNLL